MKMQSPLPSLRDGLGESDDARERFLWAADAQVRLGDLIAGSSLGGRLTELSGRSVLIATGDQLTTALAMIELDGIARRLVLCPPDLSAEHMSYVIANAGVDAIVTSGDTLRLRDDVALCVNCSPAIIPQQQHAPGERQTEWIMLTSGTTGMPKMVVHTLASLTGAIKSGSNRKGPVVWGTFYDIRRYGGLQIFFRTLLCGGSLILSCAEEPVAAHLERLRVHGVTHLSGTPSHWRRAIQLAAARTIAPQYVRLSGEIADQAILDSLKSTYPLAGVGHAYASTEAGVGFEVNDGREGFPARMVGQSGAEVEMKVQDGSLRIRSSRAALRYEGGEGAALADADGFIDTGDIVELRDDRYYFVGRRGGIINVGGLKVHPEEVEAIINRHPDVRMSLVRSRKNPITGAVVVADVVLAEAPDDPTVSERAVELRREILQVCRAALPQHKVPAAIKFVSRLDVSATGKLARHYA